MESTMRAAMLWSLTARLAITLRRRGRSGGRLLMEARYQSLAAHSPAIAHLRAAVLSLTASIAKARFRIRLLPTVDAIRTVWVPPLIWATICNFRGRPAAL